MCCDINVVCEMWRGTCGMQCDEECCAGNGGVMWNGVT